MILAYRPGPMLVPLLADMLQAGHEIELVIAADRPSQRHHNGVLVTEVAGGRGRHSAPAWTAERLWGWARDRAPAGLLRLWVRRADGAVAGSRIAATATGAWSVLDSMRSAAQSLSWGAAAWRLGRAARPDACWGADRWGRVVARGVVAVTGARIDEVSQ